MYPLANRVWSLRKAAALAFFLVLLGGAIRSIAAPPYVHTQRPVAFTGNSAVLAGMVVPNGSSTTAWFEWGQSTNYGFSTAATNAGTGGRVIRVTSPATGLTPGEVYHYRLVASNATAIVYGADQIVTTGSKVTLWGRSDYGDHGQLMVPPGLSGVVALAGGSEHNVVLNSDGKVIAWGSNDSGQTNVPPALSPIVSIAAGSRHSLALSTDGLVTAWGNNADGQTNVPVGLSNVIAIAGGGLHSVALKSDGSVVVWGFTTYGDTNTPPGLSNVVAVAAGWIQTLALKADGNVVTWGNGFYQETNMPPGISNVVAIAAGWTHSQVLRQNGTLIGWGLNSLGQTNVPAGLSNVAAIACGSDHNLALKSDGSLSVWGGNDASLTNVPVNLSPAAGIATGLYHCMALANRKPQANSQVISEAANHDRIIGLSGSDVNGETLAFRITTLPAAGGLYQFTTNGRGAAITSLQTVVTDPVGRVFFAPDTNQLGLTSFNFVANDGDADSMPATVTISIVGEPFVATLPAQPVTRTNATLTGMVTPNGFLTVAWFEWGTNSSYGATTVPVNAGAAAGVFYLSAPIQNLTAGKGYRYRLVASNAVATVYGPDRAFITGGRLTQWGGGSFVPITPPNLPDLVAAEGSYSQTFAARTDGTVLGWGAAANTNVTAALSNVVAICVGESHNLALRTDGTVIAWGDNSFGQTNIPPGLSNVVAMAVSPGRTVVLKRDGLVAAWGVALYGPATVPAGLSNVVGIATLNAQNLALRADGTVVLWPTGANGEMEVIAGVENAVALASGWTHHLSLRNDGTIVGSGNNDYNKATSPAGLSNVVAIACGANHSLALKPDGTVTAWGEPFSGQINVPIGLSNVVTVAGGGDYSLALGLNAPPRANAQTVQAGFNQDTTITLSAVDINGDSLTLRITAPPITGQLFQYATNGRGAPITSPETVISDPLGRVIFVPATNAFGLPYSSFSFATHDGVVTSPAAVVTVNIQGATFAFSHAADRVNATSAILNGVAIAGNLPTTVWFEWGNGQITAPQYFPAGSNLVWFGHAVTNLLANSTYKYRVVASNAGGIAFGPVRLFTTGEKPFGWGYPPGSHTIAPVPTGVTNTVALSGAGSHVLALQNNGSVVAWGDNSNQQTSVPPGLTNVIGIAAGGRHSLALKSDATVVAWGDFTFAQTNVPVGLTNVTRIAAGYDHSLALRSDGTLVTWGSNQFGQSDIPSSASNVVAIAAGAYFNIALRSNGTVIAWGWNDTSGQTNVPVGLSQVVAIDRMGAAIKIDGSPVSWRTATGFPSDWTNVVDLEGLLALRANGVVTARPGIYSGDDYVPPGLTNVSVIDSGAGYYLAIGNLPPVALPQAVKHAANHALAIRLTGTDAQEDPLSFRITFPPAKGLLYQYTDNGPGTQITSSNTPVTDAVGRVFFVPFSDEVGSPYTTFGFYVNDGELNSSPAVVSVTIVGDAYAATQPAAPIRYTEAVLNGMVVPNGLPTHAWFEWGTNSQYGQTTGPLNTGASAQTIRVSTPITGLASNSVIRYRFCASNAVGIAYGAEQWLTTGQRLNAWGPSQYGQTNVPTTLNGLVSINADSGSTYAIQQDGTAMAWGYSVTNGMPALSNVISVANGIALRSDGTVAVWGGNIFGETNVPAGLSDVIAVSSSGGTHRVILRANGTVVAWGNNNYGQTNVPAGLSNVVAISSGGAFSAALRADGTVVAWGGSAAIETNVPAGLSNVVAITSGGSHSLALKRDGRVVAWGDNSNGSQQAVIPSDITNIIAIACGYWHNLALRADGTLGTWGFNVGGVLSKPSWLSNAVAIAAGTYHSVILRANRAPTANAVLASGFANQDRIINFSGSDPDGDPVRFRILSLPALGNLYQFNNGTRGALISTTNILANVSAVIFAPASNSFGSPYASFNYSTTDGEADSAPATATISVTGIAYAATLRPLFATTNSVRLIGMGVASGLPAQAWFEWGTNASYDQQTVPIQINGSTNLVTLESSLSNLTSQTPYYYRFVVSNAANVAVGASQRFGLGGKVSTWGRNSYGLTNVPVGLGPIQDVAGGDTHSLALRTDGTVKAWGGGSTYDVGTLFTNVPANLSNVVAVVTRGYDNAALRNDGRVIAWGGAQYGGGPPTAGSTNVPANATNVVAIAAGTYHRMALRTNGSVVAWGSNNTYGQANVPFGLQNVVAIAAGSEHSLALRIDRSIAAWGRGQTGLPVSATNVVAIAAGLNHSLALRGDGTVVGWGNNSFGQANSLPGLSNVVQIACGDNHNLALKSDGTIVAWGQNNYDQTNRPVTLSNILDLACGPNHCLTIGGNLAPTATSATNSAYPNHDLPLSLTGSDPNGDLLGFRVNSMPTRGSLYQYNAGQRGAVISSNNTPVTDVSGRVLFAPALNTTGTPHATFAVSASDGEASSSPAMITINVVLPSAPQISAAHSVMMPIAKPQLSLSSSNGQDSFGFSFVGYSNLTYQVWASSNLVQWSLLGPATPSTNGWFQFMDAHATNWPQRFYRLSMPTDHAYNLNFTGQSNATYRVWTSTNLFQWTLLGTSTATSNGWFNFLDVEASKFPHRFYKAGSP